MLSSSPVRSPRHRRILAAVAAVCGVAGLSLGAVAVSAAPAGAALNQSADNPSSGPAAAGYGDPSIAQQPAVSGASAGPAAGTEQAAAAASTSDSPGYWEVASDGGVYAYGAAYLGQMRGSHLNKPVVTLAARPDGKGYWLVASDGGIFTFGNAGFYGSEGGHHLNKPILGAASTANGGGYWEVASDGGIFTFGNAGFYGSEGGHHLNQPIVGMATTASGHGYWMVASDGGIFTFGDAKFYGSEGGHHLNQPIVGMAATPDGKGYWLVARDGGIFSFGDAKFYGSEGGHHLNQPIIGMAASPTGNGYWMMARDGGVFSFGDAKYLGSTGAAPGPAPIVAAVSTAHGYPAGLASTGYDVSWPQCTANGSSRTVPLPQSTGLAIVGATHGYIAPNLNTCLAAEAAWAGSGMQTYLVADPLNGNDAPLSTATTGPKSCPKAADTTACGYNWGWTNARDSIAKVHAAGQYPDVWWLDVETGEGWNPNDKAVNVQIIQGMVDAIRTEGLTAGIYCTNYQWGVIAGNYAISGIPTWIAGAGNVATGTYSAVAFCRNAAFNFAGGTPWLVQYGYTGSGYDGPASTSGVDRDYACPR